MLDKVTLQEWMSEDNGYVLHDPLHKGVFTGYVNFTPERAKCALENNTHNRTLGVKRQLPGLMEAMQTGLWNDNVSKINFSSSGELSDGQHRLEACVRSQIPFRTLVTWGVTREAQLVTDRRGARKLADDFSIDGFKDSKNLAAIARILYARDKGFEVNALINRNGETGIYSSDIVVYYYFLNNEEYVVKMQKLVSRVFSQLRDLQINKSVLNVLAIEFSEISEEDAQAFWDRLRNGITTKEDDPIILLRRRLCDNARNKTNKMPKVVEAALIIKAWNFYMRGESVKQLMYRVGGANPEPFPEIYNPYKEE